MKKLNIMLGCLLIASGTLSACSYYDGSVERKPGSAVTPTVNCEQNTDCNIANHEECVVCTGQHVTDGVCTKTEEMICLKQLDSGMGCSRNAECKAGLCIATDEAGGICNCLDEASCGGGACAKIEKISTEANVCLVAKSGNPCIKDTLNCGEGLECVNNICQPKNPNDVVTPKENGVACTADTECKSGNCKSGICAVKGSDVTEKVKEGGTCTKTEDCDSNLICKENKCAKAENTKAGEGESCSKDGDCVSGLICKNNVCSKKLFGNACASDDECESGRCSESNNKCAKVVDVGGICDEKSTFCQDGLKCNNEVCVELTELEKADKGQKCRVDADCKKELVCATVTEAGNKTCENKCNVDDDCGNIDKLYCDIDTHKCMLRAKAGKACDKQPCEGGYFCSPSRICAADGTEGYDCSSAACLDGFACSSKRKKCVQIREIDQPCTENDGCESKYCNEKNVCAEAGTVGYPCKEDTECKKGNACSPELNKCIVVNELGKPCTENAGCKSGLVCDLSTLVCSDKCDKTEECLGGASKSQICEEGVCRNIVPCPNDTSKQCMIALRLTPNLQWQYGTIKDDWLQSAANGDYYSNIFSFSLPGIEHHDKLDFCARVLSAFGNFVGDDNATHIDDPILDPEYVTDGDYKCRDTGGANFVDSYPYAMGMLTTIATELKDEESNKYAAAIVKYLFESASYTKNGKTVHPFSDKEECGNLDAFACLAKKINEKSMTCDEYLSFYKQFGYDFSNLFQSPYVAGRMLMPCIELTMGQILPFKIEYRNKDSKWAGKNLYFSINLFPSPLMLMNDAYSVGMAPSYVTDTMNGIGKGNLENNYENRLNYMSDHSYFSTCATGIESKNCVKALTSKYECNDHPCTSSMEFDVVATYNLNYPNNFSCDDKMTRLDVCPTEVEQTTMNHSKTTDCGKKAMNDLNKTKYPDCVPTLAINALNFSVYVEVNDDDFKD